VFRYESCFIHSISYFPVISLLVLLSSSSLACILVVTVFSFLVFFKKSLESRIKTLTGHGKVLHSPIAMKSVSSTRA
jgi:hypothetical protein